MMRNGQVYGLAAAVWLLSTAALAETVFPETLRGCWQGHIDASPAVLEWSPGPGRVWNGVAIVTNADGQSYMERHTLTPPRPGVVNLGWRYCHPEREGRKAAERCYWMRGPSGDLRTHVTFDTADAHLRIDLNGDRGTENLFRGAKTTCPDETSMD